MVRRNIMPAKKKVKKAASSHPRRSNASRLLEEKHIGYETVDWSLVRDVNEAMRDTLRHYGYFNTNADAFEWAKVYVKKYFKIEEYKSFCKAEDWRVSTTLGGLCQMVNNGAPFDSKRMQWINSNLRKIIDINLEKAVKHISDPPVSPPVDEKTSNLIALFDDHIDKRNFSTDIFAELTKNQANSNTCKKISEYYVPYRTEIEQVMTGKDEQLNEAYRFMKVSEKRSLLNFLKLIIENCGSILEVKKTIRKPRAKKKIMPSDQVKNVKYQKDSNEYKVASQNPINIIEAKVVFLFNTKYRSLSVLQSTEEGFNIKGTTILNLDEEKCKKKTIRKPEILAAFMAKGTKNAFVKGFDEIKTTEGHTTGRINEDTIILKVFK